MYTVYIWFWPTLRISHVAAQEIIKEMARSKPVDIQGGLHLLLVHAHVKMCVILMGIEVVAMNVICCKQCWPEPIT